MAVWWESESDYDGANIQYTLNDGISWQNIDKSNAINWYNNQQVDGLQFSGAPPVGVEMKALMKEVEGFSLRGSMKIYWREIHHCDSESILVLI